jgi:hypothetical protein
LHLYDRGRMASSLLGTALKQAREVVMTDPAASSAKATACLSG